MVDGGKFLTMTATSTHPPGFPTPPAGDWPGVLVPADAVNYLLDVAQALGSPANGTAVGPFAVMVPTARPTATPLALPPVNGHVVVDHATAQVRTPTATWPLVWYSSRATSSRSRPQEPSPHPSSWLSHMQGHRPGW